MRTRTRLLVLLAMSVPLAPAVARGDAWVPQPGDYYSEFRVTHLSSDEFFDSTGTHLLNAGAATLEGRELVSYNEIGWKKHASLVFGLPGRSITLRSGPLGGTRTVTGLSDLTLGVRFPLIRGATALSVQAAWEAPLGYEHRKTPSLGAGQQNVEGHLSFGTPLGALGFLELTGGYRYRFEEPLDEIRASADVGFWIGSAFLIEGLYDGVLSAGSQGPTTGPEIRAHRASSRLTYRLDDRLDVFAGGGLTVAGKNVQKSNEFFAGLAFKKSRFSRLQGYLGGTRRP
jgi:hypothetical protein